MANLNMGKMMFSNPDLGTFRAKSNRKNMVLPTFGDGPSNDADIDTPSFEAARVSPSAHHLPGTTREGPSDPLRSSGERKARRKALIHENQSRKLHVLYSIVLY